MKVGVYFDVRNPGGQQPWPHVYGEVIELCEEAERLGAHSAWFSEHHGFVDGYLSQPLTLAAAVAGRTTRIRLGTAVLVATLRRPAHLAEEAAVVDLISDGRLDLGIGAGYRRSEFELYGIDPDAKPLARLFAAYGELRRIFDGDELNPPPVQQPLPIWLGCNGPVGARTVGRLGGRLLSLRRRIIDDYHQGLREGGHVVASSSVSGPVNLFLADDPDRVRPAVRAAYRYRWESYAAHADGPASPARDMDRAEAIGLSGGQAGLLIARVEDAARLLREHFAGVSVESIFTWARLPGVAPEAMHRHLELWCRDLPTLLAEGTGATQQEVHGV